METPLMMLVHALLIAVILYLVMMYGFKKMCTAPYAVMIFVLLRLLLLPRLLLLLLQ